MNVLVHIDLIEKAPQLSDCISIILILGQVNFLLFDGEAKTSKIRVSPIPIFSDAITLAMQLSQKGTLLRQYINKFATHRRETYHIVSIPVSKSKSYPLTLLMSFETIKQV